MLGKKVKVFPDGSYCGNLKHGDIATVTDVENKYIKCNNEGFWCWISKYEEVTEMLKIGDKVKIRDTSHAVRVDTFDLYQKAIDIWGEFEVLCITAGLIDIHNQQCHNIFIKNLKTGAIYLHSQAFVEKVKEMRVKDAVSIMRILVADGYKTDNNGDWIDPTGERHDFVSSMWYYCGKKDPSGWDWEPEWLEEI